MKILKKLEEKGINREMLKTTSPAVLFQLLKSSAGQSVSAADERCTRCANNCPLSSPKCSRQEEK